MTTCPRCRAPLTLTVSGNYLTCLACPAPDRRGTPGVLVYIPAGDGPPHPMDGRRATPRMVEAEPAGRIPGKPRNTKPNERNEKGESKWTTKEW